MSKKLSTIERATRFARAIVREHPEDSWPRVMARHIDGMKKQAKAYRAFLKREIQSSCQPGCRTCLKRSEYFQEALDLLDVVYGRDIEPK